MKATYLLTDQIILEYTDLEKIKSIRNVLEYLIHDKPLYYYFLFGYREYNQDISNFIELYPTLVNKFGLIELTQKDIQNVEFIIDILAEYQIALLYINKVPDLTKNYLFDDLRDSDTLFGGYVINELKYNGITIKKGDNMPDWDLEKMGVSEDMVY